MSKKSSYYKRTTPKQKWSINMIRIQFGASGDVATNTFRISSNTLIENPKRATDAGWNSTTNAAILKVGRFKFKAVTATVTGAKLLFYIYYLPEGYTETFNGTLTEMGKTIFYRHPEWVMAWTERDYSNAAQSNEVSLTSTLKRNLNPGDQICVGCLILNDTSATITTGQTIMEGNCQFVCRNN